MRTFWGQDEVQGTPGDGSWAAQGQGHLKTRGHWAGQADVPISSPWAFSYISKAEDTMLPVSKDPQKAARKPSESTFG